MKTLNKYIIGVIAGSALLMSTNIIAQNQLIRTLRVDDGSNTPALLYNTDALVDFQSKTRGLLLPRVPLTATNLAAPLSAFAAGMIVYNTATSGTGNTAVTPGFYYSTNTQWVRLTSSSEVATATTNALVGTGSAIKSTVNGIDATLTPVAGTIASGSVLGFDASGNLVKGSSVLYTGATAVANGVAGLVNPATAGQESFLFTGAGTWVSPNSAIAKKDLTTTTTALKLTNATGQLVGSTNLGINIDNYTGATASTDGVAGLVNPALAAQQSYIYTGAGAWVDPNSALTKRNIVTGTSDDAAISGLVITGGTSQVVGSGNATLTINNTAPLWNANKLQGKAISTLAPTTGQVLAYDATDGWKPTTPSSVTEVDGIIGNEVLNATTNKGLVRAGAGTAADPYTLGLVNGTAANQVMAWNNATATWAPATVNSTLTKSDVTTTTSSITIGNGTGQVVGSSNLTINIAEYVGATAATNGVAGLVPAASAANYQNVLRGDGTWVSPNSTLTRNAMVVGTNSATAPTAWTMTGGLTNAIVGGSDITLTINNNAPHWNANKLQGTAVDATVPTTTGQVLAYDATSTSWKASTIAKIYAGKVACTGGSTQTITNANIIANSIITVTYEDPNGGPVISTSIGARTGTSFALIFGAVPPASAYINYTIVNP
jgi:hypothetical protein